MEGGEGTGERGMEGGGGEGTGERVETVRREGGVIVILGVT